MNKVIISGRLTSDPDVRMTASGTKIARFCMAVPRPKRKAEGQQDADFVNCISFFKAADLIERYVQKGSKIMIGGHIQTGSYTNRDGVKIYTSDVVTEDIEFLDKTYDKSSHDETPSLDQEMVQRTGKSEEEKNPEFKNDGFMNIPDGLDEGGLPWE